MIKENKNIFQKIISFCWINFTLELSVWNPSLTPACLQPAWSSLCFVLLIKCCVVQFCVCFLNCSSLLPLFFFSCLFAVSASLVCSPPLLPFHSCSPLGFCHELPIWWDSCCLYLIAGAPALAALKAGASFLGSTLPDVPAPQPRYLIQLCYQPDWIKGILWSVLSFLGMYAKGFSKCGY